VSQDIEELYEFMFADDVLSFADTVRNVLQQIHCIENYCLETGMCLNVTHGWLGLRSK